MRLVIRINGMVFDCEEGMAEVASCGTGLSAVQVPEHLSVDEGTFKVTAVGDEAFSMCTMSEVVLPPSIKRIGKRAFGGCRSLQSVVMPIAKVDPTAFEGCRSLDVVTLIEGESFTAYYGRIRARSAALPVNGRPCGMQYNALADVVGKRRGDGLPSLSLYDYIDDGCKRAQELDAAPDIECGKAADVLTLMACLSPPADIDEDISRMAAQCGNRFSRALSLACGLNGSFDIDGARRMLESGPYGRLYRDMSADPFMKRLRDVVGSHDDPLAEAVGMWRSSDDPSERLACLCAVKTCLGKDIGLDGMLAAIATCEGVRELEFAAYDRIAPVLGAIVGCSSADPSDLES